MLYLKSKHFARWAGKQGITDGTLCEAIREFENGLFEASLGNHLFKKRIALPGMGKSGGSRTILFYQKGKMLIFCFGFKKSEQENLTQAELRPLQVFSDIFQNISEETTTKMVQNGRFIQITGGLL